MRTNAEETKSTPETSTICEEELVIDERTAIRPAESVETKVGRLLHTSSTGVSHILGRPVITRRPAHSR